MRPATLPRSSATVFTAPALERVSDVAVPTRLTSSAVSTVRLAAISTLRAISAVAAPCSVTAAAIAPLMSPISRMVCFDRVDGLDRAHGGALHAGDLRGDFLGGAAGLAGQRLDLAGNHGEAAAGVARARGLDGGVERQQIGLLGDVGDELDHVADAPGRFVEFLDREIGAAGLVHRLGGDGVGLRHLAVDLVDRSRQLVGGRCDVAHVRGSLGRGRRGARCLGRGFVGGAGELGRGRQHLIGNAAELGERRFDFGREAA